MTRESHDYETIADHYQAISLHLEACVEHLQALGAAGQPRLTIAWNYLSPAVAQTIAEQAEARAQAALQEMK